MWGFQSIKDSVQNHASGILRNISDRVGSDYETKNHYERPQRNAMKNVVTPGSIPEFTLPPLFIPDGVLESPPSTPPFQDPIPKYSKSAIANGHSNTKPISVYGAMENMRLSPWDGDSTEDEVDSISQKSKKSPGSVSSFSIKALMQKKWTDGKATSSNGHSYAWTSGENTAKVSDARARDSASSEQPGMSLQHLAATKSGFATLSESPNTRRKESLFLAEDTIRKFPSSELFVRKGDSRSRSPVSESNNSSARSSPRVSPMISSRNKSKSDRRHDHKHPKKMSSIKSRRRLSYDGDTKHHCCSDTDDLRLLSHSDKRKISVSEHNVSKIDCSPTDTPTPCIRVCLTYLVQHRRLNVSILDGKNFASRHSVYLKVLLLPRHDRGHRTEPIKIEDGNLSIRERLSFEAVEEEDIQHMSLKICCKEKSSRLRHADIVGECILALCDINFKTPNDIWINFNPYEEEEAPRVQLTLCYDAMLGCLTVDIVAARNVPKGSLGRQPDCYVTLTEILPNSKISKKQTKILHRTQDPVFHESFLFSLCRDAQTPDELVIVATLYVKDRVRGHTEALGEVMLGQLVENWSGRSQWAQALANEGEPVTRWHPLSPSRS